MNEDSIADAVAALVARDPVLAELYRRNGLPPLWLRPPGFPTVALFILEQQVSLASARAAYDKMEALLGGDVTPETFLTLDDAALRAAGFSRQKTAYVRGVANAVLDGSLDFDALNTASADEVRAQLTALRGIGPWTAEVYLCMVLGHEDAWPSGDRALQVAMGRAYGTETPTAAEADEIASRWRPHRAVAARLLWHEYLGGVSGPV